MKKAIGVVFILEFLTLVLASPSWATFYGDSEVGFQLIKSDRYGAAYFAPETYTPAKDWPLVVILYSDETEKGKVFCERWIPELRKRNAIGLFVSYLEPRESPFGSDKRILKLVQEMKRMFSVDESRVLLTAFGEAAHYAFYVGFSYPEYFSAVALAAGGAPGRFEPFLVYDRARAKRLPFLIVYGDQDAVIRKETFVPAHQQFHERGYRIEMEEFGGFEHRMYPQFQTKMMDWLGAVGVERDMSKEKSVSADRGVSSAFYGVPEFVSSMLRGVLKG